MNQQFRFTAGAIAVVLTLVMGIPARVAAAKGESDQLPLKLHDTPKPNYGVPVPAHSTGRVTMDKDGAATGVAGVSVTDGYSVVKTDDTGAYRIAPNASAVFLYITRPSGCDVKGSWYKPLAAEVDFTLKKAADDESDYYFINVSDTHTSNDPISLAGLSAFVEEVNGLSPAPRFVLNSGDLINLSKTLSDDPAIGRQFFSNYAGIMNHLAMPYYNVAGDHTDSSYRLDEFPRGDHRCGKPLFWEYFGPNFFSFEYGQVHFMAIDSAYHLGQRTVNGAEYPTLEIQPVHTAWMNDDMANRSPGAYVTTASETDLVEQCPGFLEMAKAHDVRFQFTGDIHVVSEKLHEVPYRTAGALSGCWWNPKCNQLCPDLRPQGYLIYHVAGDKLECFYKGLGQRVAITSHRIGAPFSGVVDVEAHVVQPMDGERLQLSLDGTTWSTMEEKSRPFYRAVFAQTMDTTPYPDGLYSLRVKSTIAGETRTQDVVVVNGGEPANALSDASLTFSTSAHTHLAAAPPVGRVRALFNGTVVGELAPGAAQDYSFAIPANSVRTANTLRFEFEMPGDGMMLGSPMLTADGKTILDVRDQALNAVKRAHWGDGAVAWGGFIAGDGQLLETPFVRKQNDFCFVLGAAG